MCVRCAYHTPMVVYVPNIGSCVWYAHTYGYRCTYHTHLWAYGPMVGGVCLHHTYHTYCIAYGSIRYTIGLRYTYAMLSYCKATRPPSYAGPWDRRSGGLALLCYLWLVLFCLTYILVI